MTETTKANPALPPGSPIEILFIHFKPDDVSSLPCPDNIPGLFLAPQIAEPLAKLHTHPQKRLVAPPQQLQTH